MGQIFIKSVCFLLCAPMCVLLVWQFSVNLSVDLNNVFDFSWVISISYMAVMFMG